MHFFSCHSRVVYVSMAEWLQAGSRWSITHNWVIALIHLWDKSSHHHDLSHTQYIHSQHMEERRVNLYHMGVRHLETKQPFLHKAQRDKELWWQWWRRRTLKHIYIYVWVCIYTLIRTLGGMSERLLSKHSVYLQQVIFRFGKGSRSRCELYSALFLFKRALGVWNLTIIRFVTDHIEGNLFILRFPMNSI